jgi:anti-anti-sigma factor
MSLDIRIIKKSNYNYFVELKGSIDSETYGQLENELNEIIDEKTKAVVLDMGGVNYISSMGIGVIMRLEKDLKSRNATFAMANLQPQVKKVFDALKVLPMISIFDDVSEADQYIDQIIREEVQKQDL